LPRSAGCEIYLIILKWASAISENPQSDRALSHAIERIRGELGSAEPNLIALFVSPHHADAYHRFSRALLSSFPKALLIGCSADGVIGAAHEVEQRAAISLTAAVLPGVQLVPFHLRSSQLPEALNSQHPWVQLLGLTPIPNLHFLLLADPFTFDAGALVLGLDATYPGSPKIGGLASGGRSRGSNALFLADSVHSEGAVGVAMSGNISMQTIVAQGCRPIGRPMMITRCEKNVLLQLDRRPPMQVLRELHQSLPERDQRLFEGSLFVGIEMKAHQVEFHPGELLVRNIVGLDPESGALAIGAIPEAWQVMQFVLRDANTAASDLTRLLERHRRDAPRKLEGALLFSCLGRGIHLYGRADHDTGLFQQHVGPIPLGGFFCNGEIGPVGGTTFIHGYTSAFALFRPLGSGGAELGAGPI
jgi:small ligand-binding sensory domain FIST